MKKCITPPAGRNRVSGLVIDQATASTLVFTLRDSLKSLAKHLRHVGLESFDARYLEEEIRQIASFRRAAAKIAWPSLAARGAEFGVLK